jgi:hypothetical protein
MQVALAGNPQDLLHLALVIQTRPKTANTFQAALNPGKQRTPLGEELIVRHCASTPALMQCFGLLEQIFQIL